MTEFAVRECEDDRETLEFVLNEMSAKDWRLTQILWSPYDRSGPEVDTRITTGAKYTVIFQRPAAAA